MCFERENFEIEGLPHKFLLNAFLRWRNSFVVNTIFLILSNMTKSYGKEHFIYQQKVSALYKVSIVKKCSEEIFVIDRH